MNVLLGGIKVKVIVRFKDKGKGTALEVPDTHAPSSPCFEQMGGRMTERMNEHCQ